MNDIIPDFRRHFQHGIQNVSVVRGRQKNQELPIPYLFPANHKLQITAWQSE